MSPRTANKSEKKPIGVSDNRNGGGHCASSIGECNFFLFLVNLLLCWFSHFSHFSETALYVNFSVICDDCVNTKSTASHRNKRWYLTVNTESLLQNECIFIIHSEINVFSYLAECIVKMLDPSFCMWKALARPLCIRCTVLIALHQSMAIRGFMNQKWWSRIIQYWIMRADWICIHFI